MTVEKMKEINDLARTWMQLNEIINDIDNYPFKYSAPKVQLISKYNCVAEDILDIIHGIAVELRKEIKESDSK